jgi:putative nucleotidyltransferase with HDIG domain
MTNDLHCPGQDRRAWRSEDITEVNCPSCDAVVELWPDEILRQCRVCGAKVSNPKFQMGCLEWCSQAADCLERTREAREDAARPVRQELQARLRDIFGADDRRVQHAENVLRLAEEIGRQEGADPLIVVPAALLHDIGLAGAPAEPGEERARTHGSDGADKAAEVLADLQFPEAVIRAVKHIVANHHDRDQMVDANGRVIWDADLIVNLTGRPREEALPRLRKEAQTHAGKLAGERLLS